MTGDKVRRIIHWRTALAWADGILGDVEPTSLYGFSDDELRVFLRISDFRRLFAGQHVKRIRYIGQPTTYEYSAGSGVVFATVEQNDYLVAPREVEMVLV